MFGATNSISNSSEIWIEIQFFLQFCVTLRLLIEVMCVHFCQLWSFENLTSDFRALLEHKILCSYPWPRMVVNFLYTHLLLEVVSPLSLFLLHSATIHLPRSKRIHWWRRFLAYKLQWSLHKKKNYYKYYFIWFLSIKWFCGISNKNKYFWVFIYKIVKYS